MQPAPARLHRTTVRVGVFVLAVVVVVLVVTEFSSEWFRAFVGDHSLTWTFIAEGVLLVGVYLVIDEIIQRRETRRWRDVMSLGVRALSTRADGPVRVVRRSVDELAGAGSLDYQEIVSSRAGELADWLRADASRARSFAEELRRSASMLEEAIIRWGPTLVEDPESAELINLLPDIVDSTRSAADTIAPAWLDRSGPKEETVATSRGWTDDERQHFRDSLVDILDNADEFQRRVSPRAAQAVRRSG